jgi:hypothetical protein
MAAVDQQTLVAAFLRQARLQPVPAATWMGCIHADAFAAVAAGDTFVTSTSMEGVSSTLMRDIPARELLAIAENCLQVLDSEAADEKADGANRYADFHDRRSVWG